MESEEGANLGSAVEVKHRIAAGYFEGNSRTLQYRKAVAARKRIRLQECEPHHSSYQATGTQIQNRVEEILESD